MNYSELTIRLLAAKECGIIKTNAQFWEHYANRERFIKEVYDNDKVIRTLEKLAGEISSANDIDGMISVYDAKFPFINRMVKNKGDKPYLLLYKGDLSSLDDLNKNVAVIGMTEPDPIIIDREISIVRELAKKSLIIVSGLAKGCDSIAHKTCMETNGKTIAILPSPINKVFPAENRDLAEEIVGRGGLVISEYYRDAVTKYEAINRFIERDRLQAMFSKAIILIASYRKGEGDSGSRHAMEFARKYEIERYVVFNKEMDENDRRFGLNQDLANATGKNQVEIIIPSSINRIKSTANTNLIPYEELEIGEQLKLI